STRQSSTRRPPRRTPIAIEKNGKSTRWLVSASDCDATTFGASRLRRVEQCDLRWEDLLCFGCACNERLSQCFNRCGNPDHIGIVQGDVHPMKARVWMRSSFHIVPLSDAAECAQGQL